MANSKQVNTENKSSTQEHEAEVLYQKLGDRWFAFSIIDDDVFMSAISEEKINEMKQERAPESSKSYEL